MIKTLKRFEKRLNSQLWTCSDFGFSFAILNGNFYFYDSPSNIRRTLRSKLENNGYSFIDNRSELESFKRMSFRFLDT